MNKTAFITWTILIVLTIVSALVSNLDVTYKVFIILLLSLLKFVGVTFQFMELKKAHLFWKVSIGAFLALFFCIVYIIY